MKPILKAMALLSGGSAVSLVLGLISAKATALLLGPQGVGYLGLLQSALGLAVMTAMAGGVSAGMVRVVMRARSAGDPVEEKAARSASWILWGLLSSIAVVVMVLLRRPLATLALGSETHASAILPLACAVMLTLAAGVQTGVLAGHQRIADITRLNVLNSVIGPVTLLPLIWLRHEAALPWALLLAGIGTAAASSLLARRAPAPAVKVDYRAVAGAARGLLRFGVPFNASNLASNGVQLALPVIVLHSLGRPEVGFYRAAAGISITYLGFLLSSLRQDYYPRAAACGDDRDALSRLINDQATVVLLVAGPVILLLIALVPTLVPLVYTSEFLPTVALLQWQLVGDVVKVSGWTMGFALARSGGTTFFLAELTGGAALLLSSWIGVRAFRLEGLGMASLTSSAISWAVYWSVLRRTIGFALSHRNRLMLTGFFGAALTVRLLPYVKLDALVLPIGLTLAVAAALMSMRTILGELGGLGGVMAWRSAS